MLHAESRSHFGGHSAALADFADEYDVVHGEGFLGTGDDLAKGCERGDRDVIASVFPRLPHVDHLQLAAIDAFAGGLRGEPPERRFPSPLSYKGMRVESSLSPF